MKKILSAIVVAILLATVTTGALAATPKQAYELKMEAFEETKTKIRDHENFGKYDGRFEPGLLDLSKLPEHEALLIEKRKKEIQEYLLEIAIKSAKKEKMEQDARKGGNNTSENNQLSKEIYILEQEIVNLRNSSKELGLIPMIEKPISKKDDVSIASTSNDVETDHIQAYYDTQTGLYIFEVHMQWKNNNYYNDYLDGCGFGICTANLGGLDGMMIGSVHRNLTIADSQFHTVHSDEGTTTDWSSTNPNLLDMAMTWKVQDYYNYPALTGFNHYRYLTWIYFSFSDGTPSPGQSVGMKAQLGHTWKDSSIYVSGFRASFPLGFSIEFSKTDNTNHWTQEGHAVMYF